MVFKTLYLSKPPVSNCCGPLHTNQWSMLVCGRGFRRNLQRREWFPDSDSWSPPLSAPPLHQQLLNTSCWIPIFWILVCCSLFTESLMAQPTKPVFYCVLDAITESTNHCSLKNWQGCAFLLHPWRLQSLALQTSIRVSVFSLLQLLLYPGMYILCSAFGFICHHVLSFISCVKCR